MAKVYNGLFSGKVGNVIYFIMGGKQYVRAYVKPGKPPSVGQIRQQARMRVCSQFLSQVKHAIMIGFQGKDVEAFGEAMKYHLNNALEETTLPESIDFSFKLIPDKIKLSRGYVDKPVVSSCIREGNTISIKWGADLGHFPNRHTDVIALAAWLPGAKAHIQLNTGTRHDGAGQMTLPAGFADDAHLWCFYWNGEKGLRGNKNNVSDSIYLGVM